jgi:hypothetical protein
MKQAFADWELFLAVKSNWKEATKWLLFTYVGGLIPVWGGYIIFNLYAKDASLSKFSDHGEFALYSAAMLAPALYYILKDLKTSTFIYRHFFALVCIVCLLVSALLYVGVASVSVGQIPATIDLDFLRGITWVLFLIASLMSFLVTALDSSRTLRDIQTERARAFKNLEQQFDKLEEQDE